MFFNSFWMKDQKNQKENYTVYVLNIVANKNKKCFIMFYIYIHYIKEKEKKGFF